MANKFKIDSFKEYLTILVGLVLYVFGWTNFLLYFIELSVVI
jgi:hypothetical protein